MPLDPAKIRARREKLKLTQSAAAQIALMPQPHWCRIEHGERNNPGLDTAERVAHALACSIDSLLAGANGRRTRRG